jgi:cell division protein ZapA (FtsZ GTPase activity inhibitor)
MSIDDHISINIEVAERPYRLRIRPDEEKYVRAAAHFVQRELTKLKNRYSFRDDQDGLVYVTLDAVTDLARHSARDKSEDDSLEAVVSKMEALLNIA